MAIIIVIQFFNLIIRAQDNLIPGCNLAFFIYIQIEVTL